jgi:hypothetical protein
MSFQLLCAGMIAMIFGLVVLLNGYKVFLILLPIWGFIFGFVLGAETLQALFGVGFLATVTSWAIGFIVGAVFAVLSYLFWIVAVALFSASIGYGLGVGLMGLIGLESGLIPWLVGVAAGVAVAAVVIIFNFQKWIVIIGTALIGRGRRQDALVVLGIVASGARRGGDRSTAIRTGWTFRSSYCLSVWRTVPARLDAHTGSRPLVEQLARISERAAGFRSPFASWRGQRPAHPSGTS